MTTKTNISSFDDPQGIYGSTADVSFGSPINMDQIVFAAMREPVAKRVVVADCLVRVKQRSLAFS